MEQEQHVYEKKGNESKVNEKDQWHWHNHKISLTLSLQIVDCVRCVYTMHANLFRIKRMRIKSIQTTAADVGLAQFIPPIKRIRTIFISNGQIYTTTTHTAQHTRSVRTVHPHSQSHLFTHSHTFIYVHMLMYGSVLCPFDQMFVM